jgi:RNA-directed DNA polymerase
LTDGTYCPGPYHNFFINEPKRRKISAAPFRDRIVHHAVVRVLEPVFEPRFIFDSYVRRRGKGTHAALERAQHFLRRHRYYLKTDIVRFYPNVDHGLLLGVLERRVGDRHDPRLKEGHLGGGSDAELFPWDDLSGVLRSKELPIGNLTSQFFSNVLLDQVDHLAKEVLHVPAYVRYADDLVLFGDDKSEL